MVICNCGKKFEKKSSLISHARFCSKYKKRKNEKISKYKKGEKYICECKREFINYQSLNAHFSHCLIHRKGKKPINRLKGLESWAKGKNIEEYLGKEKADLWKKKISKARTGKSGKKHTIETKKILSKKRIEFLKNNKNLNTKWYKINNGEKDIKVQGKWELNVAKWLNKNNIKWDRIPIKFQKNRRYTPDFYLTELNEYLEIKGFMRDRDLYKMFLVLEEYPEIKLKILNRDLYKKIGNLDYSEIPLLEEKYSKENIDLSLFKNPWKKPG